MNSKTKAKNPRQPKGTGTHASDVEVRLEFNRPAADAVFVAGSFNQWHPTATPMIRANNGRWTLPLRLSPGRHEYRLVVDGEWMPDPLAKEFVSNPYGGLNSVLRVPAPG